MATNTDVATAVLRRLWEGGYIRLDGEWGEYNVCRFCDVAWPDDDPKTHEQGCVWRDLYAMFGARG